ncbi:hypothetical protein, partial [Cytobacillus oceanisediminis]|uniref:hypothetical protein n=1 Tax=Cytobacillus oceanisediminis TaxID=665099 RepID=UPI001C92BEAF
YIVGGNGSVCINVGREVESFVGDVKRICGGDGFEVGEKVAGEIRKNGKGVVGKGVVFAEAVCIARYGGKNGYRILLRGK